MPRPLPRLPATQEQEVAVRTSFNRQRPELQLRVSEVDQETSGHALFGKAREEDRDLEEAAKKLFNLGKDLLEQEEEQEAELAVRTSLTREREEVQHTASMVRETNFIISLFV